MRRMLISLFSSFVIVIASSWFPSIENPGHTYLAEEPGAVWYLDASSLVLQQYEGELPLLDAMVYTYRNDGTSEYIEKNLWHIDVQNERYKVSATSSYDCDGRELGT